jgi:hypothetical protein
MNRLVARMALVERWIMTIVSRVETRRLQINGHYSGEGEREDLDEAAETKDV